MHANLSLVFATARRPRNERPYYAEAREYLQLTRDGSGIPRARDREKQHNSKGLAGRVCPRTERSGRILGRLRCPLYLVAQVGQGARVGWCASSLVHRRQDQYHDQCARPSCRVGPPQSRRFYLARRRWKRDGSSLTDNCTAGLSLRQWPEVAGRSERGPRHYLYAADDRGRGRNAGVRCVLARFTPWYMRASATPHFAIASPTHRPKSSLRAMSASVAGRRLPLKPSWMRRSTSWNASRKLLSIVRGGAELTAPREVDFNDLLKFSPECPAEEMDAEDPLFLLYTSGSTGKPKGVVHVHGGYMVGTTYHLDELLRCGRPRYLLVHIRYRLGGGPLVHRVRSAVRGRDHAVPRRSDRLSQSGRLPGRSWNATA